MQGKVTLINQTMGMAALFTEQGRFILLNFPRGAQLAQHDVLIGDLDSTGRTVLTIEGRQQKLVVRVSCSDCSLMEAKEALGALQPPIGSMTQRRAGLSAHVPA